MISIRTEKVLGAATSAVWAAVADLRSWSTWNSIVTDVQLDNDAAVQVGSHVRFVVRLPGSWPLGFQARVVRFEPERELAWLGSVVGIASGEHYFRMVPLDDGRTRFVHGEDFHGTLLSAILSARVQSRITDGYAQMNEQLEAHLMRTSAP